MAITRANVETILIRRTGKLMTVIGLDGTTITGANADLNDPIGNALRTMGYSVANIVAVADADIAQIPAEDYDKLLDIAEMRVLETIVGNWNLSDVSVLSRSEHFNQLSPTARLESITAKVQNLYGVGVGSMGYGRIVYDFVEQEPTA